MSTDLIRRNLLKSAAAALVLAPLGALPQTACATTNPVVREQLKYKDTSQGEMNCLNCLEFVPGKTGKDLGGCKVIPGDDEISPNGYCISWNTM